MTNACALRWSAILGIFVLMGCGKKSDTRAGPEEGLVRATFLTSVHDPDVAGVRIDVSTNGALVQSQTITPGLILPPGSNQPQEGGDAFFVLVPGDYHVSATALDAAGKPSQVCSVANASTHVAKGVTTEIVLGILCGEGTGGLDVIVTVTHAPVITRLQFDPNKFIGVCDQVTMILSAHGEPGAALTYKWSVLSSPAGAKFQLTGDGPSAVFKADTVGEYQLEADATDSAGQSAGIRFPIHEMPGPLCTGPGVGRLQFTGANPRAVKGAPYPAQLPLFDDEKNGTPFRGVPTGPFIGGKPTPQGTHSLSPRPGNGPTVFTLNNSIGIGQSNTAEPSGASGGGVVFVTSNWFAAYSTNGGSVFNQINPTTIFPNDAIGYCCDQIVMYVPSIDRFIWLLQGNGMRLAVASPAQIIASNGTAWTYWNLTPDVFGQPATTGVDYPDLAVGDGSLYLSWDNGFLSCPAGCSLGRLVVRTSLAGLAAGGSINLGYTTASDSQNAWGGHLSQDTGTEVFWAGHNNSSNMRIYSMRDDSGFYYWQDINVSTWANNPLSSTTPDGQDWMNKLSGFPGNVPTGITRVGESVWFAWSAGTDGNFSKPHIEMVNIGINENDPPNLNLNQQVQVWNSGYAFGYPALATNGCTSEVGMSFEFGGGGNYENHVVGFWGDFVAFVTTATNAGINRFGDYVSIRQAPGTAANPGNLFDAFGYGLTSRPSGGAQTDIHYVQFGRPASACQVIK